MKNEINVKVAQKDAFREAYNADFMTDIMINPGKGDELMQMLNDQGINTDLEMAFYAALPDKVVPIEQVMDNIYIDGQSLNTIAENRYPQVEERGKESAMDAVRMAEFYAALHDRDKVIQFKDGDTVKTIMPEIVPEKKGLAGLFQGIANFFKEVFGAGGSLRNYRNMAEKNADSLEQQVRLSEQEYSTSGKGAARKREAAEKEAMSVAATKAEREKMEAEVAATIDRMGAKKDGAKTPIKAEDLGDDHIQKPRERTETPVKQEAKQQTMGKK